ncbi:MAG: methyltransferase, partial [Methylophaga sp.]|nr:methyltransferase [Methylophaga sp.]
GVTDHRAKPGTDVATMKKSGYLTEALVIELAEKAGFKLAAKSDINANPADDTDHPNGVWSLLPNLRVEEANKEQYRQIGESDRMTLKFIKPE